MLFQRRVCSLLLSISFLALAGCGGSTAPKTSPVTGTVTLDGQPLAKGTVMFTPASGPTAAGEIKEGKYTLLTSGEFKGAVLGSHKVTVQAMTQTSDPYGKPAESLIPTLYGDPSKTPLTFEVNSGDNKIDIALKSQP